MILHQLYQGVIKHLVAWLTEAYGAAEIDARCRRLPPTAVCGVRVRALVAQHAMCTKEFGNSTNVDVSMSMNTCLNRLQNAGNVL